MKFSVVTEEEHQEKSLSALRLKIKRWLSISFSCIFLCPSFVSQVVDWKDNTQEPKLNLSPFKDAIKLQWLFFSQLIASNFSEERLWKRFTCTQLHAGSLSTQHYYSVNIHVAQMVTSFPSSPTFPNWFLVGESKMCPSLAVWQAWRAYPPGPSVHLKSRWQAALLFGQMYAEISRLRFVTDGFLDIVEGILPARFISV